MVKQVFSLVVLLALSIGISAQADQTTLLSNSKSNFQNRSFVTCDGEGLDGVIVEKYYVSDDNDATDQTGGSLPSGSLTYRIYLDLAPDYMLETVFGSSEHDMAFSTTTEFFNNAFAGNTIGNNINEPLLSFNTMALDSWISFGAASNTHIGSLKALDVDGSVLGGANNDGGSESVSEGLLNNNDPIAGPALTIADGLTPGEPPSIVTVGDVVPQLNEHFATANSSGEIILLDGAYATLGGTEGFGDENQILIAQVTTDGVFSFRLNFRLGAPNDEFEQYVHSNPMLIPGSEVMELTCDELTYENDPSDPSGVEEQMDSFQLGIFPNPNKGESIQLTLDGNPSENADTFVSIVDVSGRILHESKLLLDNLTSNRTITFENRLSPGFYSLNVRQANHSITKKFIVQH